ncbi:hypothetical protein [Desulfovirgula thermocuniculi]|uniref:hypothetical protein n=1 Tax=Desulfovirgula thermocuniculi TaxID=348842 RepID=UPI0012EC4AE8|nr:hypothetical protein [Desulfovirgula thermocuniculi]
MPETKQQITQQVSASEEKSTIASSGGTSSPTSSGTRDGSSTIPGLAAADIKLNLEKKWGMRFTGPRPGQTMFVDSGEVTEPNSRIKLACEIYEYSPLAIAWVNFVVEASSAAGTVSEEAINSLVKRYFTYCATAPYDGAEPDKAAQWVADNYLKATNPGSVVTTTIGPVKYEMFGTQYFRTLRLKPAS